MKKKLTGSKSQTEWQIRGRRWWARRWGFDKWASMEVGTRGDAMGRSGEAGLGCRVWEVRGFAEGGLNLVFGRRSKPRRCNWWLPWLLNYAVGKLGKVLGCGLGRRCLSLGSSGRVGARARGTPRIIPARIKPENEPCATPIRFVPFLSESSKTFRHQDIKR